MTPFFRFDKRIYPQSSTHCYRYRKIVVADFAQAYEENSVTPDSQSGKIYPAGASQSIRNLPPLNAEEDFRFSISSEDG